MTGPTRWARVRALAKINLDLRVLDRRPDGYHELRTVFQTISLSDTLDVAFTPARRTSIELASSPDIPDNLVLRAARMVLEAARVAGRVDLKLEKKIPMGGGLGGGSSDAAAVLLALPVLAGRALPMETLIRLAAELGSDVPFFLLGGTAAAIGRGTELFPLPDVLQRPGLLVAGSAHSSTAEAYAALGPRLTTESIQNKMVSFQSLVSGLSGSECPGRGGVNDFEPVVFEKLPQLAALKRRMLKLGAELALMSGSGSALFGLFRTREAVSRALKTLGEEQAFRISLVSRARYRALWWRWLQAHLDEKRWPPQSRYVQ